MRAPFRWAVALSAAALGIAMAAVPAVAAEPQGTINHLESADGQIKVLFSASGGADVDPESVTMSINGTRVEASAKLLADSADDVQRSTMLAIDTSDSLGPEGLAAAQNAAREFLSGVPDDVRVGLVTFADKASVVVQPTLDRTKVRGAVDDLELSRGTALYDAVGVATEALDTEGARSIVLMTDGADQGSRSSLADATAAVENGDINVFAVAVGPEAKSHEAPLQAIADAGHGQVVDVNDSEAVAEQFAKAAETLAKQVFVTTAVPADLAGEGVQVGVKGVADGTDVADQAYLLLTAAPAAETGTRGASTGLVINNVLVTVGFLALFGALAAILAIAGVSAGEAATASRGSSFRRRLSIYTLTGRAPVKQQETTALGTSPVARSAVELAGKVVRRRDFETLLGSRLDAAGIPLKPAEWLLIHVGIALGTALLLLLLSGGSLPIALVGIAVGTGGPWMFLSYKESARRRAFLAEMPDVLMLMAGSLAAGYSLPQAIDAVVREGQEPVAGEFNRALVEARLGVPAEDALAGVAQRMRSQDFEWVVMAIRIQREVGGNLAELLRTVADTLREREFLRRHVKALSAEGRLSAWVIGCLPPTFAVVLMFLRPEYITPLFTDPFGLVMIVTGIILLVIGVLWMRKIVKVEV